MKDKIQKVLEKYADLQINMSSEAARSILADDLERLFHQETDNLEAQVDFNKRLLNNFHMVANKYPEVKQIISGELVR
jgi:uncharacterized protein YydD (DUF2326 family)